VVSILFNRNHSLRPFCANVVAGHELAISFMTLAELQLWPIANQWGGTRRALLERRAALNLTLYPDHLTRALWAALVDQCRRGGRPIGTADAWIASTAQQWRCPLVTTDFKDYAAVDDLTVVPIFPTSA
jgi:tRNA(fMet)-specific endonuclease VapC